MPTIEKILKAMRNNPRNVRFDDLAKVCEYFFGRYHGSDSHRKYDTPWAGDPRINIQEFKDGKAKPYQVKQVLRAIELMEDMDESL